MISTTPTPRMNVVALTGRIFVAIGLRYIPQSVSLLKYLSIPVMIGPTPRPILSAHHPALRRPSKSFIFVPYSEERRETGWLQGFHLERRTPSDSSEAMDTSSGVLIVAFR